MASRVTEIGKFANFHPRSWKKRLKMVFFIADPLVENCRSIVAGETRFALLLFCGTNDAKQDPELVS